MRCDPVSQHTLNTDQWGILMDCIGRVMFRGVAQRKVEVLRRLAFLENGSERTAHCTTERINLQPAHCMVISRCNCVLVDTHCCLRCRCGAPHVHLGQYKVPLERAQPHHSPCSHAHLSTPLTPSTRKHPTMCHVANEHSNLTPNSLNCE